MMAQTLKLYSLSTLGDKNNADVINDISNVPGCSEKIFIRARNGVVYTIVDGHPVVYSKAARSNYYYYGLIGHFPNLKTYNLFNLPDTDLIKKYEFNAVRREILPLNNTDFIALGNKRNILLNYKGGVKKSIINLDNDVDKFLKADGQSLFSDAKANLYLYDSLKGSFNKIAIDWNSIKNKTTNAGLPVYYWILIMMTLTVIITKSFISWL
ncbi:MAG: hypothetical protein WDM90_20050 [Ferruginibacter sp.]